MRKYIMILFSVITFGLSVGVVNAASKCDVETTARLNRESVNIKSNYEEKERVLDPEDYSSPDELLGTEGEQKELKQNYFQVNILNVSDDFYIEVINDVNNDKRTYSSKDAVNGVISFDWIQISQIVNFTIKVYSSEATGCGGEVIRTLYLSLPRYNDYYEYTVCESIPDYYLCQKYVSFEEMDFDTFSKNVEKKLNQDEDTDKKDDEKNEDKWYTKSFNFVKEHKVAFIVGGISIIIVVGVTVFLIVRNRRRRVI